MERVMNYRFLAFDSGGFCTRQGMPQRETYVQAVVLVLLPLLQRKRLLHPPKSVSQAFCSCVSSSNAVTVMIRHCLMDKFTL